MKFTRKIAPALALLIVSAVLMTTATFAWFSMNTRATATGMQMETEAGDNVLISNNTTNVRANLDTFKNALVSSAAKANLRPVSSVDGLNFYYVNGFQVSGSGAVVAPSGYDPYVKYDTANLEAAKAAFKANYRTTDDIVPYVDYTFQVMATNAEGTSAKKLVVDSIALTYAGSAANVSKAFRVAVFANEFVGSDNNSDGVIDTYANAADPTAPITILRVSGAEYSTSNSAVNGTASNAKASVATRDKAAVLATGIAAGETKFYRVIVRVWLEGEDKSCNNATFASLDDTWSLDLGISLDDNSATKAQTSLNSTVRKVVELPGGYTIGAAAVAVDDMLYYPIMNGDDKVAVADMNNTYLFTTTSGDGSKLVGEATNFYALTEDTTYHTFHYPINVTLQYSALTAIDLTSATAVDAAETNKEIGTDPATTYYAITGKLLNGEQLYTEAVGAITADSAIYTIVDDTAVDVTVYCKLPAAALDGE